MKKAEFGYIVMLLIAAIIIGLLVYYLWSSGAFSYLTDLV